MSRQVVLDTETTGLDVADGHRVIEIGCVEVSNRRLTGRTFHQYLNPGRAVDPGALEVHGITDEFLVDKPRFSDVADEFLAFVRDSELIIHNAPFDVGFLDAELVRLGSGGKLTDVCRVLDSLTLARRLHPGQKNTLDALCKRYQVDNSGRELHGALLDAEILADVYLAMTGGQVSFELGGDGMASSSRETDVRPVKRGEGRLRVIHAMGEELEAHRRRLEEIDAAGDSGCVWLRSDQ